MTTPATASPLLELPDLSEFQPAADMPGIAAVNGGAAIIRGAYGEREDEAFTRLRAAASRFRFLGIYGYLRKDEDAAAQAAALRGITGPLAAHEIPILDIEEGDGDQAGRASAWLTAADSVYGLTARPLPGRSWIYSYSDFVATRGLTNLFASARRSWIAAYQATEPGIGHTLWQCTDGVSGPHVTAWPGAGKCDTSVFHGTVAQLAAIIAPPVVSPAWRGPQRHVADGLQSLDQIAAGRMPPPHTTQQNATGHLIDVSRQHLSPVNRQRFNTYVRGGTGRRMPAGQPYWTSQ